MKEKVVLLGPGGHAKSIISVLKEKDEFDIIGILDRALCNDNHDVLGVPIIGTDEKMAELISKGVNNAFISLGGVGNNMPRARLFDKAVNMGFNLINVISKSSIICNDINIGYGNAILKGVIVNSSCTLKNNCILNTGCIVEHDVSIGNHVHISPGAVIAGGVKIGDYTHIGLGAKIIQGVKIGRNVVIGAGAVVINDIEDNCTAVGVPARVIKKV